MSGDVPLQSDGVHATSSASDLGVRAVYGLFLVTGFILGILLQNDVVEWIVKWSINKNGDCSSNECIGIQGAYRVSFALFLFFLVHYLISHSCNCCMSAEQRVSFNRPKMILLRVVVLVVLLLVTFVVPNPFFTYYAWFALVVSCFYLIGQLILLLHFAYQWNDNWRNREENKYTYGLLVCTLAMFVGGLTLLGYLFKWFGNDSSCSTGQGILIVILLMGLVYTVLSVVVGHGSLLPSAVVFLYTVWLAYSGLSSGIEVGICNTIASTSTTQMVIGAVFSALSLGIAATNAGQSRDAFSTSDSDLSLTEADVSAKSFQFFHLMMMMGACYLAMLLTSWAITGSTGVGSASDSGTASMWVKLGSDLLCIALYLWTLVAPKMCPDRDFS